MSELFVSYLWDILAIYNFGMKVLSWLGTSRQGHIYVLVEGVTLRDDMPYSCALVLL